MKKIVLLLVLLVALIGCATVLTGCTSVTVDKPDGTKVGVVTWGSSQVSDMSYDRDADGIVLKIGSTSNTPEGMPEVIDATGKAGANIMSAGVSSAAEAVITGND